MKNCLGVSSPLDICCSVARIGLLSIFGNFSQGCESKPYLLKISLFKLFKILNAVCEARGDCFGHEDCHF